MLIFTGIKGFQESYWFWSWFHTLVCPPHSCLTLDILLWKINLLVLPVYHSLSWTNCIWYSTTHLAPFWPLETFTFPYHPHPSGGPESLETYNTLGSQKWSYLQEWGIWRAKHSLTVQEGLTPIGQERDDAVLLMDRSH